MTILEKLERTTLRNYGGQNWSVPANPDGPEASALIRDLVAKADRVLEWWPENSENGRAGQAYGSGFADDIRSLREALSKVKPLSSPLGSDTDG